MLTPNQVLVLASLLALVLTIVSLVRFSRRL